MKVPISFELELGDCFDYDVLRCTSELVEKEIHAKVHEELNRLLPDLVRTIAEDRICKRVEEIIEEGFMETTSWGEPKGERKTVKTKISEILCEQVRDEYGRGHGTRIDRMAKKIVDEKFEGLFKEEIKAAKEAFRSQIDQLAQAKLKSVLADSLGLRV